MKAEIHCSWPLHVPTDFPRPVTIHVDRPKRTPKASGSFDVLYLCEPQPILPRMSAYARGHLDLFDLVIVSTDHLLGVSDKIVPLEYGTAWVPPDASPPPKREGVSFLVGRKRLTEGHRLRHVVWRRQDEIVVPKNFFVSDRGWPRKLAWLAGMPGLDPMPPNPWGWPVLGDSKLPLFASQYSLAIENCASRFYFTEKLLDCFLTNTVPIYWGCRNLGDSFDLGGVLQAGTADELIAACNATSAADYASRAEAINFNRQRAREFVDVGRRLGTMIRETMESVGGKVSFAGRPPDRGTVSFPGSTSRREP